MRTRLAALAATCAGVSVLLSLIWSWAAHRSFVGPGEDFDHSRAVPLLVAAAVLAVAMVLLASYALGRATDRKALTGVALLAVTGLFAGGVTYYLPYLGAILGGLAVAAGERLAPPPPGDDRFTRPLPRDDDFLSG
jgi:hypothetical protein